MGLEMRNGAGPYYYRKERRAGKVCSVYVGKGSLAESMYALDMILRDETKEQRRGETDAKAEQASREIRAEARELWQRVKEYLKSAGYHTHKGQWRRIRKAVESLV